MLLLYCIVLKFHALNFNFWMRILKYLKIELVTRLIKKYLENYDSNVRMFKVISQSILCEKCIWTCCLNCFQFLRKVYQLADVYPFIKVANCKKVKQNERRLQVTEIHDYIVFWIPELYIGFQLDGNIGKNGEKV